jgi:hypothetical protein
LLFLLKKTKKIHFFSKKFQLFSIFFEVGVGGQDPKLDFVFIGDKVSSQKQQSGDKTFENTEYLGHFDTFSQIINYFRGFHFRK